MHKGPGPVPVVPESTTVLSLSRLPVQGIKADGIRPLPNEGTVTAIGDVTWALAFLDSLRSGSMEAMDRTFRRMTESWSPCASVGRASVVELEASARPFISQAPGCWSKRIGTTLTTVWSDPTVRCRLVGGGTMDSELMPVRVYAGTLQDTLSQCILECSMRGEWNQTRTSLPLDTLRSKLRRGVRIDTGSDDSSWVWASSLVQGRLDAQLVRLLSYTPREPRAQLWLQYAILLGLASRWNSPARHQIHWILHALLPGFSHSVLVDLWPCVVRSWALGSIETLLYPSPVPLDSIRTVAEQAWYYRHEARQHFEPYIAQTLQWISRQLAQVQLDPAKGWTLTPRWYHPCLVRALHRVNMHQPAEPFASVSQAVCYCLELVTFVTAYAFVARHVLPGKGPIPATFRSWVSELRTRVWSQLEAPLRDRWHLEFARLQIDEHMLYTASSPLPVSHILLLVP